VSIDSWSEIRSALCLAKVIGEIQQFAVLRAERGAVENQARDMA